MLLSLHIRDILLVRHLDIEFGTGLNVLTGETGAGKSILLDALGFVLGGRAKPNLVAAGAPYGEVVASFHVPENNSIRSVMHEAGLPESDEIILKRVALASGRNSSFINDRRIAGATLRMIRDVLVEFHGQNDDRGILNPSGHRAMLDAYGGYNDLLEQVRESWRKRSTTNKRLQRAEQKREFDRRDREYLENAVDELDKLGAQPGEDAELDGKRKIMKSAARLQEDLYKVCEAIGPSGAEGLVGNALRLLERMQPEGNLGFVEPIKSADRALIELNEAHRKLDEIRADLQFKPSEIETVEDRLFAIRAAARKYGTNSDALSVELREFRERLESLYNAAEELEELAKDAKAAQSRFKSLSETLKKRRRDAARRLDRAVCSELEPLKLEKSVFRTVVSDGDDGPDGSDVVVFTASTNPGMPSGPINRLASGGELSRFVLALKVCLATGMPGAVLIFDEADSGIGGATADAVGRRLKKLAKNSQILIVTHSPQVAAQGHFHWRVEKIDGEPPQTRITKLEGNSRIAEIGRMLAGDAITEEAIAAAGALLRAA